MTDQQSTEDRWRELVEAEMRYRGYSDHEIERARRVPEHVAECEYDWNSHAWDCNDENGQSRHPISDEYEEICGIIGRALGEIS